MNLNPAPAWGWGGLPAGLSTQPLICVSLRATPLEPLEVTGYRLSSWGSISLCYPEKSWCTEIQASVTQQVPMCADHARSWGQQIQLIGSSGVPAAQSDPCLSLVCLVNISFPVSQGRDEDDSCCPSRSWLQPAPAWFCSEEDFPCQKPFKTKWGPGKGSLRTDSSKEPDRRPLCHASLAPGSLGILSLGSAWHLLRQVMTKRRCPDLPSIHMPQPQT